MLGHYSRNKSSLQRAGILSQSDWIIKSVSLDPGDAKIVEDSDMNFSKFVRECLRRYAQLNDTTKHAAEKVRERIGVCPPRSHCPLCWPNGTPTDFDWKLFRGLNPQYQPTDMVDASGLARRYVGVEVGNVEWLKECVVPMVSVADIGFPGNHKSAKKTKKGLIRRFLAFIY